MKFMRLIVLAIVAASLSGCILNEESFNQARVVARSRPDLRAKYTAECTRRVRYADIEVKRQVAGFMHTSLDGLPEKVCGRMLRGLVSGRMQYQDFKLMVRGQRFTPNMVAILRTG
jgi:hypothetical protein